MDNAFLLKRREIVFRIYPKTWDFYNLYKKEIMKMLDEAKIIYEVTTSASISLIPDKHQTLKFRFLSNDSKYKFLVKMLESGFQFEKRILEMEIVEK